MESLSPPDEPDGMTWDDVKAFLDHIRTTCMDDRTALKLEVRALRAEVRQVRSLIALHQQNGCGVQLI